MSLAAQTVAEFGQSLGLDALELTARQGVVLSIESIGTLSFDLAGANEDAVLVSLSRPQHRPSEADWAGLLARTHFRARHALPVRVGVWRDDLVLAVLLPVEDFTLPRIQEAIQTLDQCHRAVGDQP
jgi:type III secretion system chaperone SycN